MTARAVLTELACMDIVVAVTIDAPRCGITSLLRRAAVTIDTAQLGMSAVQRKAGTEKMIEAPARPVDRTVAGTAVGAEAALVGVVIAMTVDAPGRYIPKLRCLVAVTALRFFVTAYKGE